MHKRIVVILGLVLTVSLASAKTALDLMLEGRFREAKEILETSNISPRYQLLYYALVESDAARACSLYQVVAIRYPDSDCDSVGRARMAEAQETGLVIVPIAEWSQAPYTVKSLAIRKVRPPLAPGTPAAQEPVAVVVPIPVEVTVPAPTPALPTPAETITPQEPEKIAEPEPMLESEPIAEPAKIESIAAPPPEPEAPVKKDVIATTDEPETTAATPPMEASVAEKAVVDIVKPAPQPATPPASEPEAEKTPEPAPIVKEEQPPVQVETAKTEELPVIAKAAPVVEPALPQAESKPQAAPLTDSEMLEQPAANGKWYIQVGAFANYDNAHRLALSLQKAGYPVKLIPRDTSKGKLLQVRVGGYKTREECPTIADTLKEQFKVPAVILSE
ncbi:hypothetical protein EHM69_06145 [candidate division KSB1 bacterium]|nr:MAG: hypothetical protein EHM69_06145 [candidate division KSB1 bacterium]